MYTYIYIFLYSYHNSITDMFIYQVSQVLSTLMPPFCLLNGLISVARDAPSNLLQLQLLLLWDILRSILPFLMKSLS